MLQVERITNDKFETMAEEWENLHIATLHGSFFQNWQWLYAWWKTFNRNRPLFVLAFREGRDLVGLAPLFQEIRLHWTGLSYTVLRFLGTEKVSSDHLSFLYRPGYERAVVREFLNYLEVHQKAWDNVQLSDFSDDSIIIGMLQAEAMARGFALLQNRATQVCPYLSLPECVASLYDGLSKKLSYNVRRSIRQLHKLGFKMQEVTADDDYPRAFQEMVRLHNLRWQAVSLPGNFSNIRILDFHRLLLSLKTANWQPRFFLLTNEGKNIAALYAFLYRDKLIYYQSGYDPSYDRYSPGMALMALIIEHAIGQHLREFDFLRGDESYKWKWTREYRRTMTYSIFQQKVKCGIQLILEHSLQEMKRQLKRQTTSKPELDILHGLSRDENGEQTKDGKVSYVNGSGAQR